MTDTGALERFGAQLSPAVVADLRRWAGDEALGKLYAALNGHDSERHFFDTYAEAVVARHLRAGGCTLRFEVPTPNGRACDFEVAAPGREQPFYLHVKRLDSERPVHRKLSVSSRLRYLERIERPYVVNVRWRDEATDSEMARLVRPAADFIQHARVGDELVVHDDHGHEIGGVLVVAPWEGPYVSLAIGLPSGFTETPRLRRLLERALRQFMPRAANVILVCSSHDDDRENFAGALLGSHVERWDAFPPRGKRIAHGRADDGLWHEGRHAESRAAGWFPLSAREDRLRATLFFREDPAPEPGLREALTALFAES